MQLSSHTDLYDIYCIVQITELQNWILQEIEVGVVLMWDPHPLAYYFFFPDPPLPLHKAGYKCE